MSQLKPLMIFMVLLLFFTGCSMKKPLEIDPSEALSAELATLYKTNHENWSRTMEGYIQRGDVTHVPRSHLIHAVQEFNHGETRSLCMKATYYYLKKDLGHTLSPADQALFEEFIEAALKDPDPASAEQARDLCRFLSCDVCNAL